VIGVLILSRGNQGGRFLRVGVVDWADSMGFETAGMAIDWFED
jgi:hypothetical protein